MRLQRNRFTLEQARDAGYVIVSRAHRTAARIDREDWKSFMARKHGAGGKQWVECLGDRSAADHYRRVYSRDQIPVPDSWIKELGNSGNGPECFMPLPEALAA